MDLARQAISPGPGPSIVRQKRDRQPVVPAPDDGAVEAVLQRMLRQLAKRWPAGAPPWAEDEYQKLQEEAVQERLWLHVESRSRPRRRLVAVLEGFSLHAGTWVHGNDRQDWSGWRGTAPGALWPSRG